MTHQNTTVGKIVAIATLVLLIVVVGFLLYQRRGEIVFKEEQAFSSDAARFECVLADQGIEHRLFLTTRIRYTDNYRYVLHARLISPSGQEYEKEVLDFETDRDAGHGSSSQDRLLFKFPSEEGTYRFDLVLKETRGTVTLNRVKVVIKKLS